MKLKFKHQPFQEDAARTVCSVFEGDGVDLSVEMETGVGKTYTYIKTIHELYKKYGWMKYMIVVPSIAIRKGVHKCFKELEEHFMMDYQRKVSFFVYNSDRLGELDVFAKDSGIHVMIINSQAFASNFNAEKNVDGRSVDKAARRSSTAASRSRARYVHACSGEPRREEGDGLQALPALPRCDGGLIDLQELYGELTAAIYIVYRAQSQS